MMKGTPTANAPPIATQKTNTAAAEPNADAVTKKGGIQFEFTFI